MNNYTSYFRFNSVLTPVTGRRPVVIPNLTKKWYAVLTVLGEIRVGKRQYKYKHKHTFAYIYATYGILPTFGDFDVK